MLKALLNIFIAIKLICNKTGLKPKSDTLKWKIFESVCIVRCKDAHNLNMTSSPLATTSVQS